VGAEAVPAQPQHRDREWGLSQSTESFGERERGTGGCVIVAVAASPDLLQVCEKERETKTEKGSQSRGHYCHLRMQSRGLDGEFGGEIPGESTSSLVCAGANALCDRHSAASA
jgi:hypothetical protein